MPLPLAALAAVAAAGSLYPKDAEAAKFPWMSPERLRRLISDNSYARGDKTKGGLAMVRPSEFLAATTPSPEYNARIAGEAGRFDPYKFQRESQHPFLFIGPDGEVVGHEGRHRISGLQQATGDMPVPVVVQSPHGRGIPPKDVENWSNRVMQGQDLGTGTGKPISLDEVSPFTYENNLDRYLKEIDVPLKNVGITLRPEGRGFTDQDRQAYHNYIPQGKIPAPRPAFTHPYDALGVDKFSELLQTWNKTPKKDDVDLYEWMRQHYPEGIK